MKSYPKCIFFCLFSLLALVSATAQTRSRYTFQPKDGDDKAVVVLTQDPSKNPSFVWVDQDGTVYLGLKLLEMTPELRQHFGVPAETGVLVSQVTPDGLADIAGLQVGDILTKINGVPINKTYEVYSPLGDPVTGDQVDLEYYRDGLAFSAKATLREIDIERFPSKVNKNEFVFSSEMKEKVGAMFFSDDQQVTPLEVVKIPDTQLQKKIEMLEQRLQKLEKLLSEKDK